MGFTDYVKNWWATITDFFAANWANMFTRTIGALIILIVGHYVIKLILRLLRKWGNVKKDRVDYSVKTFFVNVTAVVLRTILVFIILGVLSVNLTGIATILSAGVLALGFALQDLLGNFAAGVTLLGAKYFLTGDYIEIAGQGGTVREVKMMATVLHTPDNQVVTIPNSFIIKSEIKNYSTNHRRRAKITLNFTYDVNVDTVKALAAEVVNSDERILKTPDVQIVVQGFDEWGYRLMVRFHTKNSDYWATYFAINEALLEKMQSENIFPAMRFTNKLN